MNQRHWQFSIVLLLLCLLPACASLPAKLAANNDYQSWTSRQYPLNALVHWHAQGAIGIRTSKGGENASFSWQQNQHNYQIHLFGPFSAGAMQIDGGPKQVTLVTATQQRYQAHSAEALMLKTVGWELPVSNLYFWIRGIPAPHEVQKATFDQFNHLQKLQQQGWQIDFQRYTAVEDLDLPSLITLSRADLRIRLVVSQWKI